MTASSQPSSTSLTLEGHQILFPPLPYDIRARADGATADEHLQTFVNRSTLRSDQRRQEACGHAFGTRYDAMRELAGQIKQHTLDHLDGYLDQFVRQAKAAGAVVHFAATADQANAICSRIGQANDCRTCVKSKSMVTEETLLLDALARAGIRTVETDLGEFIIQLDHDAPTHIVQPMIHKDRVQVARIFQRELNAPYTEQAEQLTQIAHDHLRKEFRRADLGVTGANFLVAETGSIVLCTNEGNARLCTTVPPVHVAMVGIEKLVPRLEHLGVLLKLLARSSTGQPLTVYTHLISGPRRRTEPDGPHQVHIILIDNGRSEILKAPTRDLLRCIRCGACLNACPVYRKIGGHSYGAVYSGPIGAVITPLLRGLSNYKDLPHASSLCGACFAACPVKIDIPKYLIHLRQRMVQIGLPPFVDRAFHRAWGLSLRHPLTYRAANWAQKTFFRATAWRLGTLGPPAAEKRYASTGWVGRLGPPLDGWTAQRDMPVPASRSFRHWFRTRASGHHDADAPGHRTS